MIAWEGEGVYASNTGTQGSVRINYLQNLLTYLPE